MTQKKAGPTDEYELNTEMNPCFIRVQSMVPLASNVWRQPPRMGVGMRRFATLRYTFFTSLRCFPRHGVIRPPSHLLIHHRSSRPSWPGGRESLCRHYTLLLPVVNIYHYFCATGRLKSLPCKGLGVAKLFPPVDSRSGARRRLVAVNPCAAIVCEFRPAAAPANKKTARGKTFFADFSPPAIAANEHGADALVWTHWRQARTFDSENRKKVLL